MEWRTFQNKDGSRYNCILCAPTHIRQLTSSRHPAVHAQESAASQQPPQLSYHSSATTPELWCVCVPTTPISTITYPEGWTIRTMSDWFQVLPSYMSTLIENRDHNYATQQIEICSKHWLPPSFLSRTGAKNKIWSCSTIWVQSPQWGGRKSCQLCGTEVFTEAWLPLITVPSWHPVCLVATTSVP